MKWLALAIALVALPAVSFALVIVGGSEQLDDRGWPTGALALINLDTRFRYVEGPPYGGGQYHFEYRGDTEAFNEALRLFDGILVPELELIVETGPRVAYATNFDEKVYIDWRFTVWVPSNFYSLYRRPNGHTMADDPNYGSELPPPRIDVYVGEGSSIKWDDVRVPDRIRVRDHRRAQGNLLKGVVYDMNSGKVLPNASVALTRYDTEEANTAAPNAMTDGNGEYVLEDIPEGGYHVEIHAPDYAPRSEGYFVAREHAHRETATYLASAVDLSGIVADVDGSPLEGVEVIATDPIGLNGRGYPFPRTEDRPRATTDAEGRFIFSDLPEGYVHIQCIGDWYSDTVFELYRTAENDIRLVAQRRGTIHIAVLDTNGKPYLGELNVEFQATRGAGGYGLSGSVPFENGVYEWTQVPPDEYEISARFPGEAFEEPRETEIVTLAPGGVAEVTLRRRGTP